MKKILSLLGTLCLSSLALASPESELTQQLNAFTTLTADYVQSVASDIGEVLQQSTGKVFIAKPGKFRWDQRAPMTQLILVNKNQVTVYDPELLQVSIRSFKNTLNETPAVLLSGDPEALIALFNISNIPSENPTEKWFKLESRNKDALTSMIILGFDHNKIGMMQLHDSLGHVTDIRFSHVLLGSKLSDVLFEFTPPKGVDVMHE